NDLGADIPIFELNRGAIMVSGPTSNYQRVMASQGDLRDASIDNGDGTYTYHFTDPIPATYLPPLNDTASFGASDGELQGQPLQDGTYTVGIEIRKDYMIEGVSFRDVGNTTMDFLFGNANVIESREVVSKANCNSCHQDLSAHGENRTEITNCLLCHTAGSEDRNVASAAGGTPGLTIDFRVMIHKIHNGIHLPSVNGVATNSNGSRNYAATPAPYRIVGFGNSVHDFSEVAFPVWPNLSFPMPRDTGYGNLMPNEQGLENIMRMGATDCAKCHGDPDGSGPLPAPAQGRNAYDNPSRRACGSCHDDVHWDLPYSANLTTMPPQTDDASCLFCHTPNGPNGIPTESSHYHPLVNRTVNPEVDVTITSLTEAGTNDGSGTFEPGERILMSFDIAEQVSGATIDPTSVDRLELVITGPMNNRNLILLTTLPTSLLGAGPSHTTMVPEDMTLDYLADSTATLGDVFMTSRAPVWTMASSTVFARTASGFASTMASPAGATQNYLDVVDGSGFARNNYIVVDDGVAGLEEYLRIQFVDGNRLWFSSQNAGGYQPATRFGHGAGAMVQAVTLTSKTEGVDYSLVPGTGAITEMTEFGAGAAVVASYTTDFEIPATYGVAINGSPDVDESFGKWESKSLVGGTYTVGLQARRNLSYMEANESNSYRNPTLPGTANFQVGAGSPTQNYELISSAQNCYSCHNDIYFHGGGRRGFDMCITCHGASGGEDRPQYVAPNAGPTTAVLIDFREMLHKIHTGKDLFNADTYTVNGFGNPYPNNFTPHTYGHVGYPSFQEGTKDCVACHGVGNSAYLEPQERDHPSEQNLPA
ncbi:MAG: hypothetical protein KDB53_20625, partial [Planctomycetes bacterium]|nr:hypothetical protein [Planctomycetota bacterium]